MSVISGIWAAENSKDATQDAAAMQAGTAATNLEWQKELMAPYIPVGKEGVKGVSGYVAANPLLD